MKRWELKYIGIRDWFWLEDRASHGSVTCFVIQSLIGFGELTGKIAPYRFRRRIVADPGLGCQLLGAQNWGTFQVSA